MIIAKLFSKHIYCFADDFNLFDKAIKDNWVTLYLFRCETAFIV